jgi:carboxypeptidase Taq
VADLIGFDNERYDALMDEFEPGAKTAEIAKLFGSLAKPLASLIREITAAPNQPDESIVHRRFPAEAQKAFARKLAEAIGFDFERGRLDVSAHPFCTGMAPGDVRLTTRYNENHFNSAIFGVLHEAGHGVYEQGLDPEHQYTPISHSVSLGIHESQSLTWENLVGRSRPFWERFYPDCQAAFPEALNGVSLDEFMGAINIVKPSMIRVEADEATYNLHIILRFDLERALVEDSLAVDNLPGAWNAKMEELLGIRPKNDAEGCLQDIHWSVGAIGYFPTYALGKLYGAQFFAAARKAIPDLDDRIRGGDFHTLLDWLRTNIYRQGMRYRAGELVREVTGAPLSPEPFMSYLRGKYAPIYGL